MVPMGSCFQSASAGGFAPAMLRIVKRARRTEEAGNATLRAVLRAHRPRCAPLAMPGIEARHAPCRVNSRVRPMDTIRLIYTTSDEPRTPDDLSR